MLGACIVCWELHLSDSWLQSVHYTRCNAFALESVHECVHSHGVAVVGILSGENIKYAINVK